MVIMDQFHAYSLIDLIHRWPDLEVKMGYFAYGICIQVDIFCFSRSEFKVFVAFLIDVIFIDFVFYEGACMYSIQAHDGMITALTYSASYVISLGQDEKLCVWDRFQGHLLNTIPLVKMRFDEFLNSSNYLIFNSLQLFHFHRWILIVLRYAC